MSTYLLIDCNQLCHAAFHTMKDLSFRGSPTGVLYGFFSSIIKIQEDLNCTNIVFCFDRGQSLRKEVYPDYKKKRHSKEYTEEEEIAYKQLHKQISQLRRRHLKAIGFKNIFSQEGYEADDLIARICKDYRKKHQLIIVSSDKDMYQLLSKSTTILNWRTRVNYTKYHFIAEYGIRPRDWPTVKAMAGCATDEVAGIKGVGEITACKFIRGELNPKSKLSFLIAQGSKICNRNLPLVKLPFKGTKRCKLREDKKLDWGPTLEKLGIRSLNPNPEFKLRTLL